MSERNRKRREKKSKRTIAASVLALSSFVLGGVLYDMQDRQHTSSVEFNDEYGDGSERRVVVNEALSDFQAGKSLDAVQDVDITIQIPEDAGRLRSVTISNPIELIGTVEGQDIVVGYMGIIGGEGQQPDGYVATFFSPDTKLGKNNGLTHAHDSMVYDVSGATVEAFIPHNNDDYPRGYEITFSGVATVSIHSDKADTNDNGLLADTARSLIHATGTHVAVSNQVKGGSTLSSVVNPPQGIAVVRQG